MPIHFLGKPSLATVSCTFFRPCLPRVVCGRQFLNIFNWKSSYCCLVHLSTAPYQGRGKDHPLCGHFLKTRRDCWSTASPVTVVELTRLTMDIRHPKLGSFRTKPLLITIQPLATSVTFFLNNYGNASAQVFLGVRNELTHHWRFGWGPHWVYQECCQNHLTVSCLSNFRENVGWMYYRWI